MAITQSFTRILPPPQSTHNGFVFLLSAGWFTQADQGAAGSPIDGGAKSLANGGGDMQLFSDVLCTQQIPVDIVSFVTGGTPNAIVWCRLPTWTAGDTITIGRDDTQTVQPIATAPFGSQAVWQDYECVIHQGSIIDSTGNHSPVLNGSPALSIYKWGGQAYSFDDQAEYISIPNVASLNIEKDYSIQVWNNSALRDGAPQALVMKGASNTDGYRGFKYNGGTSRQRQAELSPANLNTPVGFGDVRDTLTFDGVTRSTCLNGILQGSDSPSGVVTNNTDSVRLGGVGNAASYGSSGTWDINGQWGEFWLTKSGISSDKDGDEYTNQSDPDNFGLSMPWADFGGGTVYEEDITFNSFANHSTNNNAIISGLINFDAVSLVDNQTQVTMSAQILATTNANFTLSSSANITGILQLSSNANDLMQNVITAQSQMLISASSGFIASLGNTILESLSFGSSSSDSADINLSLSGELSVGSASSVQLINNATINGQIDAGAASALSLVTSAIMSAGLEYSSISNVTMTPGGIVVDVNTPDSRTLKIAISGREFKIVPTNRELTVSSGNRKYDVPNK